MFIKKFFKKNYKKIIVISLIILLLSNKMYENFSTTQALDAVKSTEKKVNNMVAYAGPGRMDLKSGISLTNKFSASSSATKAEISNDTSGFKNLMILGNTSAGGVRKIGLYDDVAVSGKLAVATKFCIGGTCIDEDHLKVLTGQKEMNIVDEKKSRYLIRLGPHGADWHSPTEQTNTASLKKLYLWAKPGGAL
jgi:hypothetical protein